MSLPEQMLMEPVAAALSYTRTDKRDPLRILTYDLGGGTFDVTYLERSGGVIEMKAFDGNHLLGGYNFDRELVHWLRKRLEAQGRRIVLDENNPQDRGRLARLLQLAERVKIALADARTDSTMVEFRARDILVDVDGRPIQINERISREQFVQLIQPYLDETIECCRRALQKAGVSPDDLDEVLLVGGSTYGPWVTTAVTAAFPRVTPKLFHLNLCVGAGATIHAKMALPTLVTRGVYRLALDVPETSVLDVVNIAGQVTDEAAQPPSEPLSVLLRLPNASVLGPVPIDVGGRFLFEDVELRDDEPSQFHLTITNREGAKVLEHAFQVVYAPNDTETSTVTTVLPKPLYIETLDGLVPLAEEGVTLPAQCRQTFQRENDNPNISLRLFQEREPIGEIRVENIPPEGGRGSFVDLQVEVTEKNEIRGHAVVRTHDGKVVLRSAVSVHFEMPEVPSAEELRQQFTELQALWLLALMGDEERREEMETKGVALLNNVQRLFEQQPLERQEIYVALRQLRHLLNPPEDDMNPTWREFSDIVAQCRSALNDTKEEAQEFLEQATTGGDALDHGLVSNAQKALRKAEYCSQALDKLEREGQTAHQQRDRKTWARIHESLIALEGQVQERPKIETPPTIISKLFAGFEAMREMSRLADQAQRIESEERLDDWLDEINRIQHGLDAVLAEIDNVSDDLPSDQGRAQIGRIFTRSLRPLTDAIDALGISVRKASG